MRTTLTLDDDLVAQIHALRRADGLSFKGAVNQLLRAGIQCRSQPQKPKRYRTKPKKLGFRPGYDPTKLNQLADEMEAEAFAGEAER